MIAEELAEWGTSPVEVPDGVRAAALRYLLDGVGTALGGLRTGMVAAECDEPSPIPAVAVARALGGPPEATIIGSRDRVGAPAAALANGTLVHTLDFDDTHASGLVHATTVVLPAAFAVGEQVGATGRAVLDAAVVGYETVCRVAAAAPHGFHARGLHATMVAGVFSSAIVAARLLGHDAARTVDALGIAGSQAGGLLAFLHSGASTKQLHPGFAAHAGILAARLAAAGASGPANVFDGPHGVYDALAAGTVDLASVTADLGTRWETTRIGIKPYPACQLSHAAIDAVGDAMRRSGFRPGGFGPGDVAAIDVDVHPDSVPTVCDTRRDLARPASPYAAKFSLPWSVAAAVVDGDLTTATYEPDSLGRPEVERVARLVRWHVTPTGGAAADAPGTARITLTDGSTITGSVPRSTGGPDNPLTDEQLVAKFHGNAGGDDSTHLVDLLHRLEELDTIEPLMAALAAAGTGRDRP
ncbi:MmgE/PrpD family protein [Micromonospora polyrhachis]|uniref:2-methylcitrate dehydratase PrpD n=1 Tax=Micromonospora polyrhachis TaxID=1282883 RepID=A0A7W7SKM6_9ACTN|nr:MmgE/PrpD family protein [Micromonospora polyrhachis]MBB4956469.1 2-methylcitrate dehydratase PrpD [Micromonospora polyrhachis]